MKTYPNQKVIIMHTDVKRWSNSKQMYCQMGYDNLSIAIKTLSHCGLSLYLYLAKNKDGESFPLSPVDVERFTGIKGNTYTKAVKELIATGYLRQRAEGSNYYIFSVVPDAAEVSPTFEGVADAAEVSKVGEFSPEQIHGIICATLNQLAREKYNVNYNPDLDIDRFDLLMALSRKHIIVDDIWSAAIDERLPQKDILPF